MLDRIIENALPHIDAHVFTNADGSFSHYQIFPQSGYVIHDPNGDFNGPGPDGNPVYEPYYTYGGGTIIDENYNWAENPDGFEAVLISSLPPGTMIFGTVDPPHETV